MTMEAKVCLHVNYLHAHVLCSHMFASIVDARLVWPTYIKDIGNAIICGLY